MNLQEFLYHDLVNKKVAIIGTPGSGKTTLIKNIKTSLNNENFTTIIFDSENNFDNSIDKDDELIGKKLVINQQLNSSIDSVLCIIENTSIFPNICKTLCQNIQNYTIIVSSQYLSEVLYIKPDYIFVAKTRFDELVNEQLCDFNVISNILDRYQFAIFKKDNDKYKCCNIVETIL